MKLLKRFAAIFALILIVSSFAVTAYAAGAEDAAPAEISAEAVSDGTTSSKAFSSALAIGLGAAGGALGMGMIGSKAVESISRQPEAESKIRTALMLGLVFIETAIIYALLVVILIIFVL